MDYRDGMCGPCPFNPHRIGPPVPRDVMQQVRDRIRAGEAWVCHTTCEGPRVTPASLLCAGAPTRFQGEQS